MIRHRLSLTVRLLALIPERLRPLVILPVTYGHDSKNYVWVVSRDELDRARYLPE